MSLSKDQNMSRIYMIKGPTDLFRFACAVDFFTPDVVYTIDKAPFIYKYKLSQKSCLRYTYKIVIILKVKF